MNTKTRTALQTIFTAEAAIVALCSAVAFALVAAVLSNILVATANVTETAILPAVLFAATIGFVASAVAIISYAFRTA